MNLGIEGKVALVVGATGDTGSAIVAALRDEGCKVVGVARGTKPTPTEFYRFDLMREADVQALIDRVWHDHGAPDIIVHVAGGSLGVKEALTPWKQWELVMRLNLGAGHDLNRAFLPIMVQRGWGRIVHLTSNAVKLAIGNAPYAAAKAALDGYVKALGKQFASTGVVVSAVSPGPIFTTGRFLYTQPPAWNAEFWKNYVPAERWGRGEELAAAVAFLCSKHASYMPGAIVDVDGGMR